MNIKKATLIYLEDCLILSKKEYKDWKEVQNDYYDKYKTNLIPMTYDEIIDFFKEDFKDERNWPFSKKILNNFFESDKEIIKSE